MKILMVVPTFNAIGGVSSHYTGLYRYWSEDIIYSIQGRRKKGTHHAIFFLIPDFISFLYKVLFKKPDLVLINPSLRTYMLMRDGLYLLLAKMCGKKVVCFMHGWDIELARKIEKHPFWFKIVYERVSLMYVLCSDYKKQLDNIGFNKPVKLSTTKVDDCMLDGFDIRSRDRKPTNLLFLARVIKEKGIFITIDAFREVKKEYPDMALTIVGNGKDLKKAKKYVQDEQIADVLFTGGLMGKNLALEYARGDIYILPTFSEGMATTILEAMAFGLPVLTAPVGGEKDFFRNGEMGYMIASYDYRDYARMIKAIISDRSMYCRMSDYNYKYARTHFMASIVAEKMEKDFKELM